MFIFCYCISNYNKYVILLCFICNHHKILLISKLSHKLLCDILSTIFRCIQVKILPSKSFDLPHTAKIEMQSYIWGQPIVVREIATLI